MPRIVTTVHDPVALAATCRHLGLSPPQESSVRLEAGAVFGQVVHLPGVRFPIVCDMLSGLVAYHPADNAHDPYGRIMRFLLCYHDVNARLDRPGRHDRSAARRHRRRTSAAGVRAWRA